MERDGFTSIDFLGMAELAWPGEFDVISLWARQCQLHPVVYS